MRSFAFLFAIALSLPLAVPAQTMPARVIRNGAPNGMMLSDGEPISFILEHAGVLDLVDSQRTSLMTIRRKLRAANDPFLRQLDSLREALGISLEPRPRGLSEEDRKKLQQLEQVSQPVTDSIRVNNDAARLQARGLLDSAQVVRLDSLIVRERGTIGGRRPPPPSPRRSSPDAASLPPLAVGRWSPAAADQLSVADRQSLVAVIR
jgi:hypothetical protein